MKFSELVQKLGTMTSSHSLITQMGNDPEVMGAAAVDEAIAGTFSYIENEKFAVEVSKTGASALILPLVEAIQMAATDRGIAWIATAQPKLLFAQALTLFYQPYRPTSGIHPSAVIHPSATIGAAVSVGAHAVIEAGVRVGNGVCVHPNVVIYPEAEVGDRTILHANCVIHERTHIGSDCVIHSGAVIGSEGFGFVPTAEGWYKLEQSGCTVLEDGVEVGCNSAIDRPAVGETRIGRNTKIDNLVHIGHGCHVGQNCAMAAQVGMAGGVKVGNRVILAGQVGIANQSTIGDGAICSAKAGIHGNVEPGAVVSGSPAVPHKIFLKVSALTSRLPEMYQFVRQLQRRSLHGESSEP